MRKLEVNFVFPKFIFGTIMHVAMKFNILPLLNFTTHTANHESRQL